jgi:hypothetical protein
MPTLNDILAQLSIISIRHSDIPVESTAARYLASRSSGTEDIAIVHDPGGSVGDIHIAVVARDRLAELFGVRDPGPILAASRPSSQRLEILTSDPQYLYAFVCRFAEEYSERDLESMPEPYIVHPAFHAIRPVYDSMLTQHNRTARGFERRTYIRDIARAGCTHVEVNGLAFPEPYETGPEGEVLHRFYTYCPALDQFTSSRLNRGAYPADYLEANLRALRENALLAREYGLLPGMVCFEPRSVPDALLEKYPMLRGARVDHPLRSFRPRYNLSVAHPVVLDHYSEMLRNIMHEVPDLDYLSIWSNDSGAGFEYTSSLYVGRNGGGYVIREWKDSEDIARAAAATILRFLYLLRDAGRSVNPKFRVLLRLEPFWAEYEHLWNGLEDGIGVEVSSLLTTGWGLRYQHPAIPDAPEIHGTALHNRFHPDETERIDALAAKGSFSEFYFSPEILWNHEPVTGIPFPRLVYDKLRDFHANGARSICYYGGSAPENLCRWNINREVVRAFQTYPAMRLDDFLLSQAEIWVGSADAARLRECWNQCDEVLRAFPVPIWIYAGWSVWYRLWIRPLVPDIEAIPEADRAYYERHLLATAHNRTRIDLRYDVGFDLISPERALHWARIMDDALFPKLERTLAMIDTSVLQTSPDAARDCFGDLATRMRALRCLYRTQRNVALWIAGVHGYLEAADAVQKSRSRVLLREMVLDEIQNTRALHELWSTTSRSWMIVSREHETTFIYGDDFGDHLVRKIELMTGRENDEPHVDPEFQWRLPNPDRSEPD